MKRAIGFNLGLRGDIIMNTVAARSFKEQFPNYSLTLGIYKAYEDMRELFLHHPNIDDVHIYNSYDGWPNQDDTDYLKKQNYDIIFNGMPNHSSDTWYNEVENQPAEVCLMHGLPIPSNLQCELVQYFPPFKHDKKYICISPFSTKKEKDFDQSKCELLVKSLNLLGYDVFQLSHKSQPRISGCVNEGFVQCYFDSVKLMLGSESLITVNSGMAWVAAAYSHKVIGLYGLDDWGYSGLKSSKVYQPINPNSIYLSEKNVNDIPIDLIIDSVKSI